MIKNMKFSKLRICICLLIWIAGIVLCISNHNLKTDYSYLSLYVPVEKIEFTQNDLVEQEIRFSHTNVNCIGFAVVDRTRSCSGNLTVLLLDQNNQHIWQETVNVDEIELKTKKWFMLNQILSTDEVYKIQISSSDLVGKLYLAVIDQADNIQEVEEPVKINGTIQNTSLVLGLSYPIKIDMLTKFIILAFCVLLSIVIMGYEYIFQNKKNVICTVCITMAVFLPVLWFKHFFNKAGMQNIRLYICIMLIYYVAFGIHCWLCLYKKCKRTEIYFLVSFVLIGVLYSAILPPFSAPDEGTHFALAYRISNKLLGQAINDENGMIYMRECDSYEYIRFPDNEYIIDTFEQLLDPLTTSVDMVPSNTSKLGSVYTPVYLPQAIGITIGRLLHCNSIQLLYMGRLFNMLLFCGIVFWAIKIIPYGKWILYAITQIPIVMELATSYSYDTSIIAFSILYIAYIVRLIDTDEKISPKQLMKLYVLGIVFAPMKVVYLFLTGLVFLIDNEKISAKPWKAITFKLFCVMSVVLFTMFVYLSSTFLLTNYYRNDVTAVNTNYSNEVQDGNELICQDDVIYVDDADYYQTGNIEFIMNNPLDFIEDSVETIFSLSDTYILSLFGNSLGSNEIELPVIVTCLFMILYYYASFRMYDKKKKQLGLYKSLLVLGIAFAIIAGVMFASYTWTYPSRTELWGIQGRYFLPVLPLVIFAANTYKNEKQNSSLIMVFGSIELHLLVILNVISVIWTR